MNKIDIGQFIEDFKSDGLESSKTSLHGETGYNLTNYIYNRQPDTKMWHYVNRDVYIFLDKDLQYSYIEDYGIGVPNWVYDTVEMMKKALKKRALV